MLSVTMPKKTRPEVRPHESPTIALHSTPGVRAVCISGVIAPARVSAALCGDVAQAAQKHACHEDHQTFSFWPTTCRGAAQYAGGLTCAASSPGLAGLRRAPISCLPNRARRNGARDG